MANLSYKTSDYPFDYMDWFKSLHRRWLTERRLLSPDCSWSEWISINFHVIVAFDEHNFIFQSEEDKLIFLLQI